MKKIVSYFLVCVLLLTICFTGCKKEDTVQIEGTKIALSDNEITVDGEKITNDTEKAVYSANDIVFYLAGQDFTYGEGEKEDEHEQSEADAHTVVHITKPGRYVLSGKLSAGQVAVDLGEDAETDPNAVVTLILNGVDITCSVAPAIIFYNVYECGNTDEESATKDVDTSKAGANVIIADDTTNNIVGSHVAKIYKSYELSEDGTEVVDSKKLHKYDAAFYSKKSMNVSGGEKGDGILRITADNEGLDSELHLTINGGNISIISGNDGINTNEDNVSVTTINGGLLNILVTGSTGEGDGIDSNGWLVINGGSVNCCACAVSGDAGIDSDKGIYINGGSVMASGNMLDRIAGGDQTYAVFTFDSKQSGDSTYTLKWSDGTEIDEYKPINDFTYLLVAGDYLTEGEYSLWNGDSVISVATTKQGSGQMPRPEFSEDMTMPEEMEKPENIGERPEKPDDFEPPKDMENMMHPENMGERPEMPENMTPPDGLMGGKKPMNGNIISENLSSTFTITKGGNQFYCVTTTEE
ncbi:MAG: carbohydrate-binding domain-containing protein [Clostridia bacterium]|nr:carbohydrate-binding domain-containing protein [Clostridia bacterium]